MRILPPHCLARLRSFVLALAGLTLCSASALAQIPAMVSYQGRALMNNTNFHGNGQFKFALVQGAGPTLLWKNDGSPGNTEPAAAVTLPVVNGLVMVLLGDTPMTAIPTTVFGNSDVRLRVWFNGGAGFQQLTPDQRIVSVGYAMRAETVPDGSITAAKLAPGAVGTGQLNPNVDLGSASVAGRLDVFRTAAGTAAITLDGSSSAISTFGSDGLEQIRLHGTSYGELLLRNSLVNNATAVTLTAQGSTGGRLTLNNTNGSSRAILEGENTGGLLTLYTADGNVGSVLYGNEGAGSGALSLRNTNGSARLRAYGGPSSGSLDMYDADGTQTVLIQAAEGTEGSQIFMRQANGTSTVQLDAESGAGGGGFLALYNGAGAERAVLQADEVVGDGAQLVLRNNAGSATIVLDANQGTEARVTVAGTIAGRVIEITGGADLSEKFDIAGGRAEVEPGMLVCIDPSRPGRLIPSQRAYDRTAAGVVSGAGGVLPGMLMGQAGTLADGKHPVALTGRVYARVDASQGAIEPGDLITTSDVPGHGMKVTDHGRAQGAIVGKAMTGLKSGKGLVLLLVTLQ